MGTSWKISYLKDQVDSPPQAEEIRKFKITWVGFHGSSRPRREGSEERRADRMPEEFTWLAGQELSGHRKDLRGETHSAFRGVGPAAFCM